MKNKKKYISILWKYISIYSLVCLIPITGLILYIYQMSQKEIINNTQNSIHQELVQVNESIRSKIESIQTVAAEASNSIIISDFLDAPYTQTGDNILNYNKKIYPHINLQKQILPFAYSFWVFTNNRTIPSSWTTQAGLSNMSQYPIDIEQHKPVQLDFWWELNHRNILPVLEESSDLMMYSYNHIIRSRRTRDILGVINVQIKLDSLFEAINFVNEQNRSSLSIVSSEGNIIYTSDFDMIGDNYFDFYPKHSLSFNLLKQKKYTQNNNYIFSSMPIEEIDCYIISAFPLSIVNGDNNHKRRDILLVIMCVYIGTLTLIGIATITITRKVRILSSAVQQVREGDYNVKLALGSNDEFSKLAVSFNLMTETINKLITEVHIAEINQKNAEFRALEAQVNPHFLYNTLTSIACVAKKNGDNEAQKMAISLGKFYRLGLSKKAETILVSEEIEYLQMYLNIQQIRYNNRFTCEFIIPKELYGYKIIRNLLQPIVENALVHGLDTVLNQGVVRISLNLVDDCLVFTIEDNGKGIIESKVADINNGKFIISTSSGYGLKNVNDRIKLYYNDSNLLHIESKICEGTRITIEIPTTISGDMEVK